MLKKRLHNVIWILLGGCTLLVLVAAMNKKNGRTCERISVEFEAGKAKNFISKKDVLNILKENGAEAGKDISSFPIEALEEMLEKNKWIAGADLFFDKQMTLHVKINEPVPTARIFSRNGNSFYVDSAATVLPLPQNVSMRLPVFTNIPNRNDKLFDSTIKDIVKLSSFIQSDSFWQHQIAQVDLTNSGEYELVPVVGNQLLKIGPAENLEEKFSKLKLFYNEIWDKTGFEKYSIVDVRFKDQLVATKRSGSVQRSDSVRLKTKPEQTIEAHEKEQQKDLVRESKPAKKEVQNVNNKTKRSEVKKPVIKKENLQPAGVENERQPKAVMPKKGKAQQ